jgi:dTDP-4-amino-4,6-dideoxygalactose transaminase
MGELHSSMRKYSSRIPLTTDESKIESAITDKITAILATHVFGNPCHVEEIQRIADKHNLKVIYDAAHCCV